jgi:hypothetical protein
MSLRQLMLCIVSSVHLIATGCSPGGDATPQSAPPPHCGSAAAGGPTPVRDEISPLVVTSVAPDPIPVQGTDGKYHVAYELAVLNAAPRAATLINVVLSYLYYFPFMTVKPSWEVATCVRRTCSVHVGY